MDLLTLTYSQSTGALVDADKGVVAQGWAGNGEGKNNPAMQEVHEVGPLPQGLYDLGPWEQFHPGLGPLVCRLTQVEGETFGRDGFFIHGASQVLDPAHGYGQESKGCLVLPRSQRELLQKTGVTHLQVVA